MFSLVLWNCKPIWYGLKQGKGQLNVVWKAKPIQKYLEDDSFSESDKEKLRIVENIKKFAYDSLGLIKTKNYQKMYDQKGKPGMYVVTACEPFALNSYQWKFPLLGYFSYKGYFNKKSAQKEAKRILEKGYDVDIGEVNAWSTLGWFKDPVMSSMLDKNVGQLARLLIHEITHGTLFVKNDIAFNENLATFVGDQGAILFLKDYYGKDSKEVKEYFEFWEDMEVFTDFMKLKSNELALYYNEIEGKPLEEKKTLKQQKIKELMSGINELKLNKIGRYQKFTDYSDQLNNTFFTDFLNYRSSLKIFQNELKTDFNNDFNAYLKYLKKKYK